MATGKQTRWESLTVGEWYGGTSQILEYCTGSAIWYHSGKKPVAIRWVLVRVEGKLTGLVSNDTQLEGQDMIGYFVRRWSIETTFALVRAHLGVETQRQWTEKAIARTTPVLLGLFSVITLLSDSLHQRGLLVYQVSSWYVKRHPTFSDAIACVRGYLWRETNFCTSASEVIHVKMSQHQYQLWQNALAWAA